MALYKKYLQGLVALVLVLLIGALIPFRVQAEPQENTDATQTTDATGVTDTTDATGVTDAPDATESTGVQEDTENVYESFAYTVNNGQVTLIAYQGTFEGHVTVPGVIADLPVTAIGEGLFANAEQLTAVTLPQTVSVIGAYAFQNCPQLNRVNLPADLVQVGDEAFSQCPALAKVVFCGTEEQWAAVDLGTGNESLHEGPQFHEYEDRTCTVCSDTMGEFEVVFKDWNDTVLSSRWYDIGETVVVPADPTREADETYTYVFDGWDKPVAETCQGSVTYTATYVGTNKSYTVVFKNWDGTVLLSREYYWGGQIEIPSGPLRRADRVYTYTFKGWDKTVENRCQGDAVYTATYSSEYINYIVVFRNWDSSIISTQTYHYGDTVTPPAAPARPDEGSLTYTFTGWDREVTACTDNAFYTAQYSVTDTAVSDPTAPSTDPTEPGTDPTEPSTDSTEPGTDPTAPTEPSEPTDPTQSDEPTDPTNPTDPTDPTEESTEPADEPTAPKKPAASRGNIKKALMVLALSGLALAFCGVLAFFAKKW